MWTLRSGRITAVELLFILALIGMLIALCLPAAGPPPPLTDEDLNLDSWHPGTEKASQPPGSILASDFDVAGKWMSRRRQRTYLLIEPSHPDKWQVTFRSSSGCGLGRHVLLDRSATYDNGVLQLNRPVQELSGEMYQRLYTVRIYDQEYVVPSVRVKMLQRLLNQDSGKQLTESLEWEMLFRIE